MVGKAARRGVGSGHSLETSIHLRVSRLEIGSSGGCGEKVLMQILRVD